MASLGESLEHISMQIDVYKFANAICIFWNCYDRYDWVWVAGIWRLYGDRKCSWRVPSFMRGGVSQLLGGVVWPDSKRPTGQWLAI